MTPWQQLPLESFASRDPGAITDGPFGSNLTSAHYTDSGPHVIRLQNIGDGEYRRAPAHISREHFHRLRKHEVIAGDLLVASLGEVLPRACLMPADIGPAIVKADCIRVRLSPDVEPRWVLHALQRPAARDWAKEQLHGVGRPRLGLKTIRQIPIPAPPLNEQRRIVDILEDHLSRLEAAQSYIDASRRRLPMLRTSILLRERRALRESGAPVLQLGEVATTALGKMLDAKNVQGTPTRYLRNANVRWGSFDLTDIASVPLSVAEQERFEVREGDLLVCEGGEPGRCAVWRGDPGGLTYQKALHRVRPNSDHVSADYLALMLESVIRGGEADHLFTGTTIKHLPQEKLRRIEFPVPDIAIQVRVVESARRLAEPSELLAEELRDASQKQTALRRAVLTAAYTGQLTGAASDSDRIEELAVAL